MNIPSKPIGASAELTPEDLKARRAECIGAGEHLGKEHMIMRARQYGGNVTVMCSYCGSIYSRPENAEEVSSRVRPGGLNFIV